MRYIEINKDMVPYTFQMSFNGKVHDFEVNYNHEHDFFTLDLAIDGEVAVLGEKIVYGRPLFSAFESTITSLPYIVPYDVAKEEERVSYENLGEKVFLFIEEV